jgi:RNA polymerase sigma-70 factor (ECF subfamily)
MSDSQTVMMTKSGWHDKQAGQPQVWQLGGTWLVLAPAVGSSLGLFARGLAWSGRQCYLRLRSNPATSLCGVWQGQRYAVVGSDMTHNSHTNDWMARLVSQDHATFVVLVKEYHRRLLGFARMMAGETLAEDIMQEAWTAIFRGLPGFQGRASLSTWLYTIVRNECITRLKKEGRMPALSIDAPAGNDAADDWFDNSFAADGHWTDGPGEWTLATPEAMLEESQLLECLEKNIRALQDNQEQVFRMRDLEQMPLEEICNVLGLTKSNVRVLLHRARLRLQQVVDHYQRTGEC